MQRIGWNLDPQYDSKMHRENNFIKINTGHMENIYIHPNELSKRNHKVVTPEEIKKIHEYYENKNR